MGLAKEAAMEAEEWERAKNRAAFGECIRCEEPHTEERLPQSFCDACEATIARW